MAMAAISGSSMSQWHDVRSSGADGHFPPALSVAAAAGWIGHQQRRRRKEGWLVATSNHDRRMSAKWLELASTACGPHFFCCWSQHPPGFLYTALVPCPSSPRSHRSTARHVHFPHKHLQHLFRLFVPVSRLYTALPTPIPTRTHLPLPPSLSPPSPQPLSNNAVGPYPLLRPSRPSSSSSPFTPSTPCSPSFTPPLLSPSFPSPSSSLSSPSSSLSSSPPPAMTFLLFTTLLFSLLPLSSTPSLPNPPLLPCPLLCGRLGYQLIDKILSGA